MFEVPNVCPLFMRSVCALIEDIVPFQRSNLQYRSGAWICSIVRCAGSQIERRSVGRPEHLGEFYMSNGFRSKEPKL